MSSVDYTAPCPTCKQDADWQASDNGPHLGFRVNCPTCTPTPPPPATRAAPNPDAPPTWAWIRTLAVLLPPLLAHHHDGTNE